MQGTCTIDGCEASVKARGYCGRHYYRDLNYGDPLTPTRTTACLVIVRYDTMHDRIRGERGRAALYACEHCGKPARDWAYDGEDPDERIDAKDGKRVFSIKLEHYHPLCRSCHRLLDWDRFYAATHRHVSWHATQTICKYGHPFDEANTDRRRDTKGRPGRRCRKCHAISQKLWLRMTPEERQARKAAGLPVVDLAAYFAATG